jgi:hypothetical protein
MASLLAVANRRPCAEGGMKFFEEFSGGVAYVLLIAGAIVALHLV